MTGANCEDFVAIRPGERKRGLEDLGVRLRFRALADGGNRIVHPHPAGNGESGNRVQCVGEG